MTSNDYLSAPQDLESFLVKSILPHLRHSTPEECLAQDTDTKQKVENYVTKVIAELKPVEGTVAETYLRRTRKLARLPHNSSLKFHPNLNVRTTGGNWISGVPALVAVSGHPRSNTNNIQITYLDFKLGTNTNRSLWPRDHSEVSEVIPQVITSAN